MKRMKAVVLALGLALTIVGHVAAHDTFVMPQKFRVFKGETVIIGFHSSDGFPESAQLLKRLQDPAVHTPSGPVPIENVKADGMRMTASITVPHSGHVIVTAVNGTATTDMKADEFVAYLKEEGLTHVVDARVQRGEADKPGKERYTMYAKTILMADAPNDGYKKVVGFPIEMIPEKDPYQLKPGESLPVRVLFRGAPARNLDVKAASTAGEGQKQHSVGRTDVDGRINVPVTSGKWRLKAIHMERSSKPDVEWESFWTTLTFEIS